MIDVLTSYYSAIPGFPSSHTPIGISLYVPKGIQVLRYHKLAPSKELLDWWKEKPGRDWEEYKKWYTEETLGKLNKYKTLQELFELAGNTRVILLCYEGKGNCHRHIVSQWLPVNVKEL